jgi:hypothetical protein
MRRGQQPQAADKLFTSLRAICGGGLFDFLPNYS